MKAPLNVCVDWLLFCLSHLLISSIIAATKSSKYSTPDKYLIVTEVKRQLAEGIIEPSIPS